MMRSIAATMFSALLPFAAAAQCVSPADVPVSPVRFVPTCSHSVARIAANEGGAFSVWSSVHAGFSMITSWMSGTVLDLAGAPLRPAEHIYQYGSASAELATDGRDYLMVLPAANGAWARVVSAAGEITNEPVQIVSNSSDVLTVRVVWNGDAYVVAVSDSAKTTIALVSSNGDLAGSAVIAAGATIAALSPAGRGSVLALLRTQTGFESVIVRGVKPEPRLSLPIPATAAEIAVATNGSGFLAVWRDSGRIAGFLLDSTGVPAGPPIAMASNASDSGPAVVRERDTYVVLWGGLGVEAARVSGGGAVGARFAVMPGVFASAAYNGEGTIVLARSGCASIASAFVPRGAQRAEQWRDISLAAVSQGAPQLVATPFGHQLFWSESSALFTTFVAADGAIAPARPIAAENASVGRFVALRAGESTLVIWSDFPGGSLPGTLRVSRFDARGNEIDSHTITAAWFLFGLAAASNGSDAVVAWTEQKQNGARFDVRAARLSASGEILNPPALLSIPSDDMYEVVAGVERERAIVGWRNGANTLVTVETGSQSGIVNRREIAMPSIPVLFPVAVAIHDAHSLVAWWAESRLHATDPVSGLDVAVDPDLGPIRDVRIFSRGDDWLLYFSEYDYPVTQLRRALLHGRAFGEVETLQCAPGSLAYTLNGDRIDALVYSGPDPAVEGASRLRFRSLPQPRRRATR